MLVHIRLGRLGCNPSIQNKDGFRMETLIRNRVENFRLLHPQQIHANNIVLSFTYKFCHPTLNFDQTKNRH